MNEGRHLRKRGRIWRFRRRIPESFRKIDSRDFHECTLNTSSILLARERRDAIETADLASRGPESTDETTKAQPPMAE